MSKRSFSEKEKSMMEVRDSDTHKEGNRIRDGVYESEINNLFLFFLIDLIDNYLFKQQQLYIG